MKLLHLTSLSLALAGAALVAQESTGTLVGAVRGESGRPVAGARVLIQSPVMLQSRTVPTNENGEFRAQMLPPGAGYSVTVTASGLLTQRVQGLAVSAGVTRRQDFVLKSITAAAETVDIVAVASSVDKTNTTTSSSFSLEQMESMPAPSLNGYGALAMAPGVAGNITYPVIRGAITGQSQFLVNGVSVRDPMVREGRQDENVIDDLIEDIQVIQSPMNAKYGFTSGGIVNIVTKTGTNEFHGGVRVKLRNDAWTSGIHEREYRVPLPEDEYGRYYDYYTEPYSDNTERTYEVNLRGPIWKDHVTFSYAGRFIPPITYSEAAYNLARNGRQYNPYYGQGSLGYTYGQAGISPLYYSGTDILLTQNYKLFWQIAENQTLSFEAMVDKSEYFDDQLSGRIDLGNMFLKQLADSDIRTLQYNGIFGNFVVDLKWGTNSTDVYFSYGPGDPIYVGRYGANATRDSFYAPLNPSASASDLMSAAGWGGAILTNGDLGDGIPEHRNSQIIDANVQWIAGSHQIDFGLSELKEMVRGGGYPGVNNTVYYVPGRLPNNADGSENYVVFNVHDSNLSPLVNTASTAVWRINGRIPMALVRSTTNNARGDDGIGKSQALYVNDFYTLNNNWSAMLGLRMEKYTYDSVLGKEIDTSSVLPRFTIKYDIFGDNQHVLDFSFGQFRGTMGSGNLGTYWRSPNNRSVNLYWNAGAAAPGGYPEPYLVPKEDLLDLSNYSPYLYNDANVGRLIDPGLKPEMRTSLSLNYTRSYPTGYFRAAAVFDTFSDLWYVKIPNWSTYDMPKFETQTKYGSIGLSQAPTSPVVDRMLTFDPHGERDYRSLEIEWQQRLFATAKTSLTWAGNWTMARIYSTRPWREGNVGDNAAYYYPEWDALGVPREMWNPKGELTDVSEHHNIKSWLAYHVGDRSGVQTDLTFMASYVTGRPYDVTYLVDLPPELMEKTAEFQVLNYARYAAFYFGSKRGRFLNQDGPPSFDLKWNMSIPFGKKVELYSTATIFNAFNHFSRTRYSRDISDNRITAPFNVTAAGTYRVDTSLPNFGLPLAPFLWVQDEDAAMWTKGYAAGNQGRYNRGGWSYNARYFQFDVGFRF